MLSATRKIRGKTYHMRSGRIDRKADAEHLAKQYRRKFNAVVIKAKSPSTGKTAYWVFVNN